MHIIAIATSFAAAVDILFAFCVEEVGNRGKLGIYFFAVEETTINVLLGIFGVLLFAVLDVNVSNDMVPQVIDHDHILYLSVLHHFFEYFFVEILKPNFIS